MISCHEFILLKFGANRRRFRIRGYGCGCGLQSGQGAGVAVGHDQRYYYLMRKLWPRHSWKSSLIGDLVFHKTVNLAFFVVFKFPNKLMEKTIIQHSSHVLVFSFWLSLSQQVTLCLVILYSTCSHILLVTCKESRQQFFFIFFYFFLFVIIRYKSAKQKINIGWQGGKRNLQKSSLVRYFLF